MSQDHPTHERAQAQRRKLLGPALLVVLCVALLGLWQLIRWQAAQTAGPPEVNLDAFILLEAGDTAAVQRARELIAAQGGIALDFFPPRVLLASIPPQTEQNLVGREGILAIYRDTLDAEALSAAPEAQIPASVWNGMLRRGFRSRLTSNAPPQKLGAELVLVPPEKLQALSPPFLKGDRPGLEQTSEFLCGSVRLDVFLLESNGTVDPNDEDWTPAQRDRVAEEIVAGANWWAQAATYRNQPFANLSFSFVFHDPWQTPAEVSTGYEPINRSWQDVYLPITEVMANLGYTDSNWIQAVRRYVHDRRCAEATDWGVAVFVVNSAKDPNGAFADGAFAFAYLNGPCIVLTYDCSTWGVDSMEMVFAHELAHSFGALDEYAQSGFQPTDTAGYLNVANTNSEKGNPSEDSIMRGPASLIRAYRQHLVSTPVRGMLGWQDADDNGWYDVLGVAGNELVPLHSGFVYTSSVTYDSPKQRAWILPWRWQGLPRWANSTGITHVPVTIDYVANVLYRVDGGNWLAATPQDGAFDGSEEGYAFTITGLAAGRHTVESIVVNAWHSEIALRQDTFDVVLEAPTPTPIPTATATATPGATPSPSPTQITPTAMAPVVPTPQEVWTITFQNGLWDYAGCSDTRISAEVPNSNLVSSDLKVGAKQNLATLIRFNLSSIPSNAIIESASLSLFGIGREGSGTFDIDTYAVYRPWIDSQATWNKASAADSWTKAGCNGVPWDRAEMPGSYVIIGPVGWYTWNVREDVQRMVNQPESNQGWLLRQSTARPGVLYMCSSEYRTVSMRPKLVVTYRLP
jgi:hypothetical protein